MQQDKEVPGSHRDPFEDMDCAQVMDSNLIKLKKANSHKRNAARMSFNPEEGSLKTP